MLSIISTPIGNLGDITLRAIETLKNADAVVCEDTRVTGNLLHQLNIPKKKLIALHGYSDASTLEYVLSLLKEDQKIALVSDAGTPGISDPGYVLVSTARAQQYPIEVIPGPAAFLAALSASGLPINQFLYLGFLPLKKGRKTLLATFIDEPHTIVFYESVHRIEKTLIEIADALKEQPERSIAIARELTKIHEEVISTSIKDLPTHSKSITKKGEFVVVIGPKKT